MKPTDTDILDELKLLKSTALTTKDRLSYELLSIAQESVRWVQEGGRAPSEAARDAANRLLMEVANERAASVRQAEEQATSRAAGVARRHLALGIAREIEEHV